MSLVGAFSASNQACCADFSLAPIPPKEALGEADSMDFSWQSALCAGRQGAGWKHGGKRYSVWRKIIYTWVFKWFLISMLDWRVHLEVGRHEVGSRQRNQHPDQWPTDLCRIRMPKLMNSRCGTSWSTSFVLVHICFRKIERLWDLQRCQERFIFSEYQPQINKPWLLIEGVIPKLVMT